MAGTATSAEWQLAIPFAAIGVPLLVTGVVMMRRRISARLSGALVDAEVVSREAHRISAADRRAAGDPSGSTVVPRLRYLDAGGQERIARLDHQARQRLRSEGYRLRYPLGARVRVRIDPRRPDIAYDDTIGSMVVFPGLLASAGLLMSLLALGIYFGS